MGKLTYGPLGDVHFDDRVLAHLQLVIGLKLRRDESFFFSWIEDAATSEALGGRRAIWLDQSIPLAFHYAGGTMPKINREWLEILTISSNSPQGLQLTSESD